MALDPRFSSSETSTSAFITLLYEPTLTLLLASAHEAWNALSDLAELVRPAATNRAEFLQECREGKLDGVVAAFRTFFSVRITGLVDEELVNALPRSLKYLAHCGTSIPSTNVRSDDILIRALRRWLRSG